MEKTERATTSRMETDEEIDDTSLGFLSNSELDVKLKSLRFLCVENKINDHNAFEMDITGILKLWLERKKNTQGNGVKMFKEVGDFLEASEKLYKYRINNLSENTEALIQRFRAEYSIKSLKEDNEGETRQILKPKRSRLMLTTSEKLNHTPTETYDYYSVNETKRNIKMDFKKLFTSYSRPSDYILSMFSSSTLAEELKKSNIKETGNRNENMHYEIRNMNDLQKKIKNSLICPEFNGFIADHDKNIDSEELQLEGIEYRFDPNNYTFMDFKSNSDNDNSTCDEISLKVEDNTQETGGLLECIDGVNNDYSFFNPIRLTNWKEPKSQSSSCWKTQAIAKALKSSKSSKRNEIIYDTDERMAEATTVFKKKKECNNVNNFKGMWKTMSEIDTFLLNNTRGLEQINPHKWNLLPSTKSIIVDPTIRLTFLEYYKVQPYWWSEENETDNKSISTQQSPIPVTMLPMDKSHIEEDDDLSDDFITETKFNIVKLKEEIKAIIDQECVGTNSESEWSSRLSFLTLLQKLRVLEREELSIAMVFVGLLHLVNEHGLKLFEEPGSLDKVKEVYIAKPIIINQ